MKYTIIIIDLENNERSGNCEDHFDDIDNDIFDNEDEDRFHGNDRNIFDNDEDKMLEIMLVIIMRGMNGDGFEGNNDDDWVMDNDYDMSN